MYYFYFTTACAGSLADVRPEACEGCRVSVGRAVEYGRYGRTPGGDLPGKIGLVGNVDFHY